MPGKPWVPKFIKDLLDGSKLAGGGVGQVLSKKTAADFDFQWADAAAAGAAASLVSFSAHRNGVDLANVAPLTSTKIPFTTEDWDQGNCFDPVTSRFQPAVAGKYAVILALSVNTTTAGKAIAAILKKNGGTVANVTIGSGNDWPTPVATCIVDMNGSSDYIEGFVYHELSAAAPVLGGASYTYFQGFLLGGGGAAVTDITGRVTDYALAVGETAKITYTGATSVPLRVATAEGVYELRMVGDFTGTNYTPGSRLVPNSGGLANGAIDYFRINLNGVTTGGAAGSLNGSYDGDSYSSFVLPGVLLGATKAEISTYTKAKTFVLTGFGKDAATTYQGYVMFQTWADTATPWTSLGTLTFSTAQSGTAIIRRIA